MSSNTIIEELTDLRKRLCLYGGTGPCDCKFWMKGHHNSEFSGCAELGELIDHLEGRLSFRDRVAEMFDGQRHPRDYMNENGQTYD